MFKIYKKIFNKATGKEKPKQKTMARKKLLSPEQKKNILAKIKSGAGTIYSKAGSTPKTAKPAIARPTVARTAIKTPKPPVKVKPKLIKKVNPVKKTVPTLKPSVTPPKESFWTKQYDWKFFKPTGFQIVAGGTATVILGGLAVKAIRR